MLLSKVNVRHETFNPHHSVQDLAMRPTALVPLKCSIIGNIFRSTKLAESFTRRVSVPLAAQPWQSTHLQCRRHLTFGRKQSPAEGAEPIISPSNETPESRLFKMGSSLASRLATDRKLQCTEVDSNGEIVANHKEVKKSDLVSKASYNILSVSHSYANEATVRNPAT